MKTKDCSNCGEVTPEYLMHQGKCIFCRDIKKKIDKVDIFALALLISAVVSSLLWLNIK